MIWLRLLACSLLWIPAYAIMAVLWLLGIPIVLGLCLLEYLGGWRGRYVMSPIHGRLVLSWLPKWAWLWSNSEDNVDGPSGPQTSPSTLRWMKWAEGKPFWLRAFSWSALRNSVANERMLYEPIECHGEADTNSLTCWASPDVRWAGNSSHVHEDWKYLCHDRLIEHSDMPCWGWRPRFLWSFAAKGMRAGLWVRRMAIREAPEYGYDEIRIGFKIIPAPARNAERYAGLGLQFHHVRSR